MNRGTLATAALLALSLTTAAAAQTTYRVTVNTSALSGTTGNLDFQFNPFGAAAAATDVISGFTSTGTLAGAPTPTGGVTGILPGPLTFTNSTGYNDYFQAFTFGNSLTFLTTFSGNTVNKAPASDTFAFSLYDSTGTTPLLTNDPSGSVAEITINPNGTFSTRANPNSDGSASVATIALVPPAVPEASTTVSLGVLLALGLGGIVLARKRKASGAAV